MKPNNPTIYDQIIEQVFFDNYVPGLIEFSFDREELSSAASKLRLVAPKNLGDIIYSFRYRKSLPKAILSISPAGHSWVIRGAGLGKYTFALVEVVPRIVPSIGRVVTKIPDATPEIVRANTIGDEQGLLALVRYNRLIDIFLGVSAYSLQNHLRTTVTGIGQVEVDEIYVAVDSHGVQSILPTQAKGGTDQIGIVQTEQDIAMCQEKFPDLTVRPIAVQFTQDVIVLFELMIQDGQIVVLKEGHYKLVGAADISDDDRELYRRAAGLPSKIPFERY